MDIKNLNLVNYSTKVTPNYPVSGEKTNISLYFSKDGRLLIVGKIDNNYIYWASFTNIDDREKNEAIFNYIADESFKIELVSNEHLALKAAGFDYEGLKTWYKTDLDRVSVQNMAWKTPFGHYYGRDQIELNGRYFAGDVAGHLNTLLKRCQFREANGAYREVLDYCFYEVARDSGNPYYYRQVEDLINMLRQEQYLVLSDDDGIREKYLRIFEEASELYGRCQSSER